jgi:uncharacterized protein YbbC (DUF1343 family)
MFSYARLFQDAVFASAKKIVFFGNQSSFDYLTGAYLFDTLIEKGKMLRLLAPEHGLFSEMQDQEGRDGERYRGVECRSLYDVGKTAVNPDPSCFEGADALLLDIPDVGVRYFTYTTHMYRLLECLRDAGLDLPVFIIDKPNPAGLKIEGIPMPESFASFVGLEGLIHRHGMRTGQLAVWMCEKLNYRFRMRIISVDPSHAIWPIPPSPNIPGLSTIELYAGQCFWEATTWSEGRGTTRPFEIFGHPELSWAAAGKIAADFQQKFAGKALLRPLRFIPAFHKHAGKECVGFQLHLLQPATYHCIFGSLYLMRLAAAYCNKDNFWRSGAYEFDSSCSAAEVLIGDELLIGYVNGKTAEAELADHLTKAETGWRKMMQTMPEI